MTRKEAARYLLMHPAELGRRLGYADLRDDLHGKWMLDMIAGTDDYSLQAHRGAYKTTCLTIAIAETMLLFRSKSIMFLRKTDADITEVISQVKHILESPIVQQIYLALTGEQLVVSGNKSEVTTSAFSSPRGVAQLIGIGLGGSLTGKHADIVITDDIVNRLDRVSRAERERTKSVYMELQNIRNRGGRIINTGTPWHKDDAFSIMPKPEQYDCYTTGLITKEKLEELRRSMSPSLFAANYELRHIAEENTLFKEFPKFTDKEEWIRDGIAHIDCSYGGEDYTAFTCGRRMGDTIYLYGRIWQQHVDTVMNSILADSERLMCAPIFVETNGDKGYVAREIQNRGGIARMYAEHQNKYLKISTYLRKWWPNIVFLEGTDQEYYQQILDYSDTAAHDDAADSAACVCRLLDRE